MRPRIIPVCREAVELNIEFLLKVIIQKINRKCEIVVIAACAFMYFFQDDTQIERLNN